MGAVPAVNGLDGPASDPTLTGMRLPWAAILLVAILAAQGLLARVVVHCHDQDAVVAVNHQVSCCDHGSDEDAVDPPCGEGHDCDPGCDDDALADAALVQNLAKAPVALAAAPAFDPPLPDGKDLDLRPARGPPGLPSPHLRDLRCVFLLI